MQSNTLNLINNFVKELLPASDTPVIPDLFCSSITSLYKYYLDCNSILNNISSINKLLLEIGSSTIITNQTEDIILLINNEISIDCNISNNNNSLLAEITNSISQTVLLINNNSLKLTDKNFQPKLISKKLDDFYNIEIFSVENDILQTNLSLKLLNSYIALKEKILNSIKLIRQYINSNNNIEYYKELGQIDSEQKTTLLDELEFCYTQLAIILENRQKDYSIISVMQSKIYEIKFAIGDDFFLSQNKIINTDASKFISLKEKISFLNITFSSMVKLALEACNELSSLISRYLKLSSKINQVDKDQTVLSLQKHFQQFSNFPSKEESFDWIVKSKSQLSVFIKDIKSLLQPLEESWNALIKDLHDGGFQLLGIWKRLCLDNNDSYKREWNSFDSLCLDNPDEARKWLTKALLEAENLQSSRINIISNFLSRATQMEISLIKDEKCVKIIKNSNCGDVDFKDIDLIPLSSSVLKMISYLNEYLDTLQTSRFRIFSHHHKCIIKEKKRILSIDKSCNIELGFSSDITIDTPIASSLVSNAIHTHHQCHHTLFNLLIDHLNNFKFDIDTKIVEEDVINEYKEELKFFYNENPKFVQNNTKIDTNNCSIHNDVFNPKIEGEEMFDDTDIAILQEKFDELTASSKILKKIQKYHNHRKKMEEFEISASDPTRLWKNSSQLLQEDKFRKSAYPTLLKMESELISLLESYEKNYHRPFLRRGDSFLSSLQADIQSRSFDLQLFGISIKPLNKTLSATAQNDKKNKPIPKPAPKKPPKKIQKVKTT